VGSDFQTHGTPRTRAVADAPVETLLGRTDELARRWAIALIVALPLERIGDIPLDGFAREAPSLFAQVVRALRSDSDLERLIAPPPNGAARHATGGETGARAPQAHRLGALTGARDGTAAVQAVEALRGVLWEALLGELRWPSPEAAAARQMADLADRLAHVCSSVLVSALESVSTAIAADSPARPAHEAAAVPFAAHRAPAYEEEPTIIGGAVIVDEARDPAPRRSRAHGTSTRAPFAAAGDADAGGQVAARRAAAGHAAAGRSGALPWDFRRPGEDVA
jgi:hypothetical protein